MTGREYIDLTYIVCARINGKRYKDENYER